jgi:hypothetical protein
MLSLFEISEPDLKPLHRALAECRIDPDQIPTVADRLARPPVSIGLRIIARQVCWSKNRVVALTRRSGHYRQCPTAPHHLQSRPKPPGATWPHACCALMKAGPQQIGKRSRALSVSVQSACWIGSSKLTDSASLHKVGRRWLTLPLCSIASAFCARRAASLNLNSRALPGCYAARCGVL